MCDFIAIVIVKALPNKEGKKSEPAATDENSFIFGKADNPKIVKKPFVFPVPQQDVSAYLVV